MRIKEILPGFYLGKDGSYRAVCGNDYDDRIRYRYVGKDGIDASPFFKEGEDDFRRWADRLLGHMPGAVITDAARRGQTIPSFVRICSKCKTGMVVISDFVQNKGWEARWHCETCSGEAEGTFVWRALNGI